MTKTEAKRLIRKEEDEKEDEDEKSPFADAKKDTAPAVVKDEDDKDEDDKDDKAVAKTLGRIVNILGKFDERMSALEKSAFPLKLEGQYEDQEAGISGDKNPEGKTSLDGDKVHTLNAPENAVKPNKDTMKPDGAFTGPDDGKMGKMMDEFRKSILAEVAKTVKASTPTPVPYKDAVRKNHEDAMALLKEQVYAAVEFERKNSVFSSDAENGDGGFLQMSIPQAEASYLFLRKMADERANGGA